MVGAVTHVELRWANGWELVPERLEKASPCRSNLAAHCGSSQTSAGLRSCTLLECHVGPWDWKSKWF